MRAPCRRNPHERADRIKIAERFGDVITADHKSLNEDQESRMHVCSGCARLGNSMDSKLNILNQINSGDDEKSSNMLTLRRKSEFHLYGQFSGIHHSLRRAELES